jgi:hypothetical protein
MGLPSYTFLLCNVLVNTEYILETPLLGVCCPCIILLSDKYHILVLQKYDQ